MTSSWSAAVPDVIWTKFTIKWWENGKNLPLLSTQTHWSLVHLAVVILTSIILLLGVFDVCRKFGKDIDSSSVWLPVLGSQFGVPEQAKQWGEKHLVTSITVMATNTIYKKREKPAVWRTVINTHYLNTTPWQDPVNGICLSRQACGELPRDGVKTKAIALVL